MELKYFNEAVRTRDDGGRYLDQFGVTKVLMKAGFNEEQIDILQEYSAAKQEFFNEQDNDSNKTKIVVKKGR